MSPRKMEVDPQIMALLEERKRNRVVPLYLKTPEQARVGNPLINTLGGNPERVASISDVTIPGPGGDLLIRAYVPEGKEPFPVLIYFHGGGWIVGNLESHDSLCRSLANGGGCTVIAVDYRLAPEHKFPAPVHDAYAATQWAFMNASRWNIDPHRIAIGGDSAGGTLAAAVCLIAREKGKPELTHQLLIYPVTNIAHLDSETYQRFDDLPDHFIFTKKTMEYCREQYLPKPEDRKHPYASPLLAEDLKGLPPATIVTAEYDILTAEGEAYARRLRESGVAVDYTCYTGMIHPFLNFAGVADKAREAIDEIGSKLRAAFRTEQDRK